MNLYIGISKKPQPLKESNIFYFYGKLIDNIGTGFVFYCDGYVRYFREGFMDQAFKVKETNKYPNNKVKNYIESNLWLLDINKEDVFTL